MRALYCDAFIIVHGSDMQVHLSALGCRLNEAELEHWARRFQAAGHGVVTEPEAADLMVLNTCAVTGAAARKSRRTIRRLHRSNPTARLVVSGCYATLEPQQAATELGVDLVVANADKDRLVERVGAELNLPAMPAAATEPGEQALFVRGRSRAFVKVQDGCRYQCTFCITTVARGAERSRPVAEVVDEVNRLQETGVAEVVLTGVQLGGYGHDGGSDLVGLLAAVLRDTDIPRIRLGSLEPWGWPDGFLELFANPRLMPHLHLPLQSGSDRVLQRMARRCWTTDFARLAEACRAAMLDCNLTTDLIVGFPGETEADWRATLDFVERIGFGHLHIFPYSPRAGTRAASLPDPVEPTVRQRRVRELHALGRRLKQAVLERHCGRVRPVLWEATERAGRRWGYTPNYLRVALPAGQSIEPGIYPARLAAVDEGGEFIRAEL